MKVNSTNRVAFAYMNSRKTRFRSKRREILQMERIQIEFEGTSSCSLLELNDRKVLSSLEIGDNHFKTHSTSTLDPCLRRCAYRISWPFFSRFETHGLVGWRRIGVDLPGCSSTQSLVWPVSIEPIVEDSEFSAHVLTAHRSKNPSGPLFL